MNKTSFFAGLKLFAAQAALQVVLHGQGFTLEQASAVACGVMLLAPLYSKTARELYSQAFLA
jgi:hypothetical protein